MQSINDGLVSVRENGEMRRLGRWEFACIALLLNILACGPLSPPESCGDFGSTADEGLFDEYFDSMELFYAISGMPGEIGAEGEIRFKPDDELAINFESEKMSPFGLVWRRGKVAGKSSLMNQGVFAQASDHFSWGLSPMADMSFA